MPEQSELEKLKTLKRLAWVARILIEQHVNATRAPYNGLNILTMAYISCEKTRIFENVRLLLEHGAAPNGLSPRLMTCLSTDPQFAALVASVGRFEMRPPRVCPCWSGKPLAVSWQSTDSLTSHVPVYMQVTQDV